MKEKEWESSAEPDSRAMNNWLLVDLKSSSAGENGLFQQGALEVAVLPAESVYDYRS